jgi:hypothetical protein
LAFSLYDFHLGGLFAQELASTYSLPADWVEERIEAVRLCLKYQVKPSVSASANPTQIQFESGAAWEQSFARINASNSILSNLKQMDRRKE